MPNFLIDPVNIENNIAKIRGSDARHIQRVLRKKAGDSLTLTDGIGNIYESLIIDIDSKEVTVEITKTVSSSKTRHELVLYQCLPRLDKMDLIVQKAVELGIIKIIPLVSQRSQSIQPERLKSKEKRWQRIADEAAKQCRQPHMPIIEPYMKLNELGNIGGSSDDEFLAIALWEEEKAVSLRKILSNPSKRKKIALLVGPEGGLNCEEVDFLKSKGWLTAGLGSRILRLETAAIVGMGIIQYELGDLSPEVDDGIREGK